MKNWLPFLFSGILLAVGPILYENIRTKEPLLCARLTREVYSGKEYLLWAVYADTSDKPQSQVTIRMKEIPGLLEALSSLGAKAAPKGPSDDVREYIASGRVPF